MSAVELRVIVSTDDTSEKAADRIEHAARRCLGLWFDPLRIYVEQATTKTVKAVKP